MKKYRTSELYIIKLARVTKIVNLENFKDRETNFTPISEIYVAKKSTYQGDNGYKLINFNNVFAYADNRKTKFVGDIFVSFEQPFNYFYSKEKISAKEIEQFEKDINKSVHHKNIEQVGEI